MVDHRTMSCDEFLDRAAFEIVLYSTAPREDAASARFRSMALAWKPVAALDANALARQIFADRIGRIEVSATMAITAAALKLKSEGVNLADFGAGEPHFATPRHIKDAAIDAIEWLLHLTNGRTSMRNR